MNSGKIRTFAVCPVLVALVALVSPGCSGEGSSYQDDIVKFDCDCVDVCTQFEILPGALPSDPGTPTGRCIIGGPGKKNVIEVGSCVDAGASNQDREEAATASCGLQNTRKSIEWIDVNGVLKHSAYGLVDLQKCVPKHAGGEMGSTKTILSNACNVPVGKTHSPLTATSDPGLPTRTPAVVSPADSSVTVTSGSQSATFAPDEGSFVIETTNCAGSACDFIIPTLNLYRFAFDVGSQRASDVTLVNTTPLKGRKAANGTLTFTTAVDFVVNGMVGPVRDTGFATAQPGQLSGTYDSTTSVATLSGTLVSADQSQRINVNLKGAAAVRPPRANAGADQTIACTGAPVRLNGSASTKTAPGALRYYWTQGNTVLGTTAQIDTTFSTPGAQSVLLTVVDSLDQSHSDVVLVNVTGSGAPKFTSVPGPLTVADCTSTPNLGQAKASTSCGAPVTITNDAPARFAPGTTKVTWKATSGGVSVTATQLVTVLLGDNPACCPAGSNVIKGTPNGDQLTGTSGADCILGLGSSDTLSGGGGNDLISGGEGDDTISGGAGDDRLFGGNGQNVVTGGAGNDLLCGGSGDDRLTGDAGDDTLTGLDGQDQLFGSDGNDTLDGGNGSDRLDGGAGPLDVCSGGSGSNTFTACEKTQ